MLARIYIKIGSILIVLLLSFFPAGYDARAEKTEGRPLGLLWTADLIGFGNGYLGINGGLGGKMSSGFVSFSYGFSDIADGRIKLGYTYPEEYSDQSPLAFAFDTKLQLIDSDSQSNNNLFDFAIGGFFEIVYFDDFYLREYGGYGIISVPYHFQSEMGMTPYLSLNLRYETEAVRVQTSKEFGKTRLGSNLGVRFDLKENLYLYTEAQIDGNSGVYAGLRLKII